MNMEARNIRRELTEDGFLMVSDAEKFSGLKKSKLYALMAAGELPYAKIGSARRIPKRALIDLMARNLVIRGDE